MKYISFAIPCYNSEAYMEKAINSILIGGEDVEILIVNDGSKDGTQEIAERVRSSISDDRQGDPKRKRRTRRCSQLRTFIMPQENILK